jgi:hypothetical protein
MAVSARAIEHRELAGIAAVGFDPIAGATRNQRRRNHVTRHVPRGQRALQLEAARARFATALHLMAAPHALDEAHNRRNIRGELMERGRPLPRQQHRGHRRGGVLIKRNDGCRLLHDRPPLYAALLRAVAG